MGAASRDGRPARRRAFWLLARREGGRIEVLAAELAGGGRSLPVFGFAEEAALFSRFGGLSGGGWQKWETGAGELASLLLGPCRGVGRVALDPPPEIGAGPLNRLASVGRERFVRFLLDRGAGAAPSPPADGA